MEETTGRLGIAAAQAAALWETGIFGAEFGPVAVAFGLLVLSLLVRGRFARLVGGTLRRRAERAGTAVDDAAVAALIRPLRLVPVTIGLFLAVEALPLQDRAQALADDLVRSLAVFVLFWAAYRLIDPIPVLMSGTAALLPEAALHWLVRGLKIACVFLGAVTVLEIWGIRVVPILAGLGLIGVAVALGAQDLFRNLIAGLLIIGERRFARGDWVMVAGVAEGTVEAIDFRSTRIRKFDAAPVYVPNAKLSDEALVNFSRMTHRRIFWTVGVEYRTTVDQLARICREIDDVLAADKAFAQPPEAPRFVRVDGFSPSSIDIMVYCFTKTVGWGEWLAEKERLACRIKEIVEGAGSAFAFPTRSVHLVSDADAEIFVPPVSRQPSASEAPTPDRMPR